MHAGLGFKALIKASEDISSHRYSLSTDPAINLLLTDYIKSWSRHNHVVSLRL